MASPTSARLRMILGENNTEKLTLPNGIPGSLNELLNKVEDLNVRRECVLKSLIYFLGENADDLVKEYIESSEDVLRELEQLTMAVFVIRKEGEQLLQPPEDIGIIIEGVEVLHDLTSVASACALLLGLIYALGLSKAIGLHI